MDLLYQILNLATASSKVSSKLYEKYIELNEFFHWLIKNKNYLVLRDNGIESSYKNCM